MIRPAPIGMLLILWFIGEYIAFTYVISVIGLGGAVLVGVATFLLGINSLRHIGLTAFSRIRQQANPSRTGMEPVIHSVGAILLIVPGFFTAPCTTTFSSPRAGTLMTRPFLIYASM